MHHLLHEYYIFKIQQKVIDKEKKVIKEIVAFLVENECLEMTRDPEELKVIVLK